MDEDTIVIPEEDVEIIDASEYKEELSPHFNQVPEVAKPLLKEAKQAFSKIEKALYTATAFINAVKAAVPDVTLQAILTDEQKQQIGKGGPQVDDQEGWLLDGKSYQSGDQENRYNDSFEVCTDDA